MSLIIRPRQTGKTYELVQWVKEGERTTYWPFWSRTIVTFSEHEAKRLMREYDLKPGQVFSTTGWRRERNVSFNANRRPEVAVDNADLILTDLLGGFEKATMTGEPYDSDT